MNYHPQILRHCRRSNPLQVKGSFYAVATIKVDETRIK